MATRRPYIHPGQPLRLKPQPSDIARFLSKIEVDTSSPRLRGSHCWKWTAATDAKGYGQLKLDGRACWAHRVAYQIFRSRIRIGQDVDHICFNRSCVNPDHLRAISRAANSARQPERIAVPF